MILIQNSCKHCGAPISNNKKCDYCGSNFQYVSTPVIANFKNGGGTEIKKNSFNKLTRNEKFAIIFISCFAPIQILRFLKK